MAEDPKNPVPGTFTIDASECAAFALDLATRAGLLHSTEPAFDGVTIEVVANQPPYGDGAGVTASDLATLQNANQCVETLDKFIGPLETLVETLKDSRAHFDDLREGLVHQIAKSIDERAPAYKKTKQVDLTAKYPKTLAYRSAHADKAVATRHKNAQAGIVPKKRVSKKKLQEAKKVVADAAGPAPAPAPAASAAPMPPEASAVPAAPGVGTPGLPKS